MVNRRWRPALYGALAAAVIWTVALAGYHYALSLRMTAEKVQAYASSIDLSRLTPEQRRKALHELARMLNSLSLEERRKARLDGTALGWFEQMTESEKSEFVDETMPTGFKQMLTSFENLPDEQRKLTVENALRNLRQARNRLAVESGEGAARTNVPVISKELEAKFRTIGLKTFYSQSSAQTKAELAPVLEELQRSMESGRMLHQHP